MVKMAGAFSSVDCAMRSALRRLILVSETVITGSLRFRLQKYRFAPSGSFIKYRARAV